SAFTNIAVSPARLPITWTPSGRPSGPLPYGSVRQGSCRRVHIKPKTGYPAPRRVLRASHLAPRCDARGEARGNEFGKARALVGERAIELVRTDRNLGLGEGPAPVREMDVLYP